MSMSHAGSMSPAAKAVALFIDCDPGPDPGRAMEEVL